MPIRLSPQRPRPLTAVTLALASLLASAALSSVFLSSARDAWVAAAATGPAGPADGILLVTGLGGTVLSLWLGIGLTLSALSALPGALGHGCRRLAARVAPAAVRKAVALVLGTTLTAALVPGTALGDSVGIAPGALRPTVVAAAKHATSGLTVAAPDASFRLVSRRPPARDAGEARGVDDPRHGLGAAPLPVWSLTKSPASLTRAPGPGEDVVVLRGDTLWSIAARHLGPAASAADIDAEWHRWLAANRDVIGDDPNLILPGQLLRPPPSTRAGS